MYRPRRTVARFSPKRGVGGWANHYPRREVPDSNPFLSQQATRILGLNPGLPRRVSVSPTCPLVHLCLFFETGWGHDTPSLPPYECQGVGFFCYPFYYEAPEVLGCIHQWSSFPIYNRNLSSGCSAAFAACCPEPFMGIPSWVDCQPKPPLLRAVHLG